jgi:hypothetical protein
VLSHATGVASIQTIEEASDDMAAVWSEAGEAVITASIVVPNLDSRIEETVDKRSPLLPEPCYEGLVMTRI